MSSYDYKILSLDGGGIRSIVQGVALKELPRIDYDLIVGTSGGAINACLLSIGYTPEDIIEFYSGECGKQIFKANFFPVPLSKSRYPSKNIEKMLNEKLGNFQLKDVQKNIVIVTYDIKNRRPVFFSNLNEEHRDIYLRDIARASSAAPLYFEPYTLSSGIYIDGGLSANTPSAVVIGYVKEKLQVCNPLVVSLGTGSFQESLSAGDLCVNNPIKFIINLIDCFMDGNQMTQQEISSDILQENFFRFQIHLDEKNKALDNINPKNIQNLIEVTMNSIKNEWSSEIERLKKFIVSK